MSEWKVILDDEKHRTISLNTELCDTAKTKISAMVVYKKDSSGNFVNYLVIKSLGSTNAFEDLEIPMGGIKIPPEITGQ